jgi:hypothetical protein
MSQIPEARRQIVENARQSWIRKLIDPSRRNNLLYFRPLKTGTLDLTSVPSERLRDLLMGQIVAVAKLAPDLEDEARTKIVRDIFRRALENSEEKGLSTLFVTFGMATWPALDGGRPAESPVLLLPVAISKKEGSNSYYLASTGAFQLNLVLLHVLEDQFKLKLHPENLLGEFAGDEDKGTILDIKGLCENIQREMADARGFEIGLRVVLGNFALQEMAMVKDLQERTNELPMHDVIAAIAGDSKAKSAMNAEQSDPDPKEFDLIPPDDEFLVLAAASSQQRAIAAVMSDQSRVIHSGGRRLTCILSAIWFQHLRRWEVSKQSFRCRLAASGDSQIKNTKQRYDTMDRSFRARPPLRGPWITQKPGIHSCRCSDSGHWNRGHHGGFRRYQRSASASASIPRCGQAHLCVQCQPERSKVVADSFEHGRCSLAGRQPCV